MPVNIRNLLTVIQAAKIAGVHRQTIYLAIWEKRLKVVMVGNHRYIDQADLKRWMEDKE